MRRCRGGKHAFLSGFRQQMRAGAAHGEYPLCGILGPAYGVAGAFGASLIRNLVGLGSLMAFPGSMLGALLCGLVYRKTGNLMLTLAAEVFGTAVLGGLCAYPVAVLLMGQPAGEVAFYAYIIPFLISTAVGSVLSGVLLFSLERAKALGPMQEKLA